VVSAVTLLFANAVKGAAQGNIVTVRALEALQAKAGGDATVARAELTQSVPRAERNFPGRDRARARFCELLLDKRVRPPLIAR